MNKKGKTVLVVDAGGRGAALVDKYAQSTHVKKILVVPGNVMMQINTDKPVKIFPEFKTTSVKEIIEICKKEKVDLVDVAQDNAVEVGLVDSLEQAGFPAVGPSRLAGQIEWDKSWSRDFMIKYKLPVPKFFVFNSQQSAISFLKKTKDQAWFVKVSGLAEGKGALPAENNKEAIEAVKSLDKFGKAAESFLLEDWLIGEEFSSFALCDGEIFQYLGSAQDHKRIGNFDQGENTGGVGCVSNPRVVTKEIIKQVDDIFKMTIDGLKSEGRAYKGILYLGGILVGTKVYIIEFNARWGDPEVEVVLPGIKNDWYQVSAKIASSKLGGLKIKVDEKVRVSIAGCSKGYPGSYSEIRGKRVFGIKEAKLLKSVRIYGAGVSEKDGKLVATGGRVLHVVGEGVDVLEARAKAYQAMALISIEGNNLNYRTDIGWRDIERMRKVK